MRRLFFVLPFLLLPLLSLSLSGCGGSRSSVSSTNTTTRRVEGIVLLHEEGTPRTPEDLERSRLIGALPGLPFPGNTIIVRKIECAGPGLLDACRVTGEVTRLTVPGSLFSIDLPPGVYSFVGTPTDAQNYDSPMREWAERSTPISTQIVITDRDASIYVFYDYPP
jgi:hypothetical protein